MNQKFLDVVQKIVEAARLPGTDQTVFLPEAKFINFNLSGGHLASVACVTDYLGMVNQFVWLSAISTTVVSLFIYYPRESNK